MLEAFDLPHLRRWAELVAFAGTPRERGTRADTGGFARDRAARRRLL